VEPVDRSKDNAVITSHVYDLVDDETYLRVPLGGLQRLHLKIEGLNPAGSIKLKTARGMIEGAETAGIDLSRLIESTSGNFGIALAAICAAKRYSLICVVDGNTNAMAAAAIRALGAELVTITQRDVNGGFLGSRIAYIERRLGEEKELLLDPGFFAGATARWPGVSSVEVLLKRATRHNELSRFRYDVVLQVGAGPEPVEVPEWRDWAAEEMSLESLRRLLSDPNHGPVGIASIPNARLGRRARTGTRAGRRRAAARRAPRYGCGVRARGAVRERRVRAGHVRAPGRARGRRTGSEGSRGYRARRSSRLSIGRTAGSRRERVAGVSLCVNCVPKASQPRLFRTVIVPFGHWCGRPPAAIQTALQPPKEDRCNDQSAEGSSEGLSPPASVSRS